MGKVQSALTIDDLKSMAQKRVPKLFFDYADSGSLSEQTYRANKSDFNRVLLRQRIARLLTDRSLKTTMVGEEVAMPLAIAPTGLTGMQYADGEMKGALAAEKFGVPFALSTMSICSIEDVKSVTTKPFWFQLYVMRDTDFVKNLLDRAKAAGCSALVLTMDLQILAQRHKDLRNQLSAPPKITPRHLWMMMRRPMWCLNMATTRRHTFRNIVGHAKGVTDLGSLSSWTNEQFDPELSWDDVAWIKDYWGGKLIIKGVLDAEDAKMAADTGADALIVSNHGGRQLDGTSSSIRALPQIVEAVGKRIEIHLDGGIRTGVDIARALALGAKSTWVGRPFLYGLGAGGEAGVKRMLDILYAELDVTMALCGERNITDMGSHNVLSVDW
ncbi:MAG TPA: alpha-hydroxy-acid oxidizing protein [Devosia sp.]|nr:alpha-hydroxy-acid oxidizing protein [Devosia sp.]